MEGLSGRRRLPRPSCLVEYNSILLLTTAVKFYIGDLCLLCRFHDGSAPSSLLGKCSFIFASLDSRINAWDFVSDLHACVGFRGNKKVEKHRIVGLFLIARVAKHYCSGTLGAEIAANLILANC